MKNIATFIANGLGYFWRLFALLLILCALVVQLGRMATPMVSDYRQPLVDYLTQKFNLNVEIGSVAARWESLLPVLAIENLVISTPAGKVVLEVESALAEVDLLDSIYDWQPRFSDVEFLGVRSNFIETVDGNFSLEGLTLASSGANSKESTATKYSLDDLRDIFLIGKKVNLIDLVTRVTLQSGHELDVTVNRIQLEHGNNQHRLSASIQLEDKPEAITLIMEGSGDPFDISEFGSKAYVRIDNFPTEKLMALVGRRYWQSLPEGQWRRDGQASVEAWLTITPDEGLDWVGQLKLSGLPFEMEGRQVPFRSVEGEIVGSAKFDGSWSVQFQQVNMQWGSTAHPPFSLQISSTVSRQLSLHADQLVLQYWHRWLSDSYLLPEKAQAVLDEINPAGSLKNVHVTWPASAPEAFLLQANLSNVSVDAWTGAPALTHVDGYIESNKSQGFVDLDSQDGFSMHYTSVYDDAMNYDAANGQIAWWVVPERQAVFVNSGPIHFRDGNGSATGFLYIDAPFQRDDKTLELLLQIGIENTPALMHKKYVPFVVSENLRDWLGSAVQGGDVTQGGFIFHGFISPEKKQKPSIQLWLDIENASLDYQPPWPAISEAKAELILDSEYLLVNASAGKIYNSAVKTAKVELVTGDKGILNLLIDGDLSGPLFDGWRVLTETPLAETTNHLFDTWKFDGDYGAKLALNIPLGDKKQAPKFDVDVRLSNAKVDLPFLKLTASDLSGSLNVSNSHAVTIQSLQGTLWGESLKISSSLNVAGDRLGISLDTQASIEQLIEWAGFPPVKQVAGKSDYQVQIDLPWGVTSGETLAPSVLIQSDLIGLKIELPEPLLKTAEAAIPFSIHIPLGAVGLEIKANAGKYVDAILNWEKVNENFAFDRGAIQLFGQAYMPDQPRLVLGANFQSFDVPSWLSAFEGQWGSVRKDVADSELADAAGKTGDFAEAQSSKHLPIYIVLNSESVFIDQNQDVGSTHLEAIQKPDRWVFSLQNERIEGQLDVPLIAGTEMNLSLNVLRLPLIVSDEAAIDQELLPENSDTNLSSSEVEVISLLENSLDSSEKGEALWTSVKSLPPMHVKLDSIYIKDKNVGKLEFHSRVQDETLRLDDISGALFGLAFSENSKSDPEPASLVWDHALNQTSFSGYLRADDLGTVMTSMGVEKLIESNRAEFGYELSWLGDPYTVRMGNLEGQVNFNIKQGRFIRAEASASNALMRLMGILNFDTWIRRLQLDFSDVYSSGMAYDDIKGELSFNKGLVQFNTPVVVRTPSSKMQMQGEVNLTENTIDSRLTVNLPVLDNLTFLAAVSAGLPVAAGVFVASRLFEKQFDQMTSVNYNVVGTLDNPSLQFKQVSDGSTKKTVEVSPAKAPDIPSKEDGAAAEPAKELKEVANETRNDKP